MQYLCIMIGEHCPHHFRKFPLGVKINKDIIKAVIFPGGLKNFTFEFVRQQQILQQCSLIILSTIINIKSHVEMQPIPPLLSFS